LVSPAGAAAVAAGCSPAGADVLRAPGDTGSPVGVVVVLLPHAASSAIIISIAARRMLLWGALLVAFMKILLFCNHRWLH
jgi:hypothetical protein